MKIMVMAFLFFLSGVFTVHAQLRKVPAEVTDALKAKFPGAEKVEWKDKLTYFEADFMLNSEEMSADFSNSGIWKETDKKMNFDDLPDAVKDGFKKSKFNDWTPGSVTRIDKNDKSVAYKIYAEKSSLVQKKFLYFNESGQLEKDVPGI